MLLIGGGLWYWLSDPQKDLADWFFKEDAAHWETVNAFYYPDRNDLSIWRTGTELPNVQACRDWVCSMAVPYRGPGLMRGDTSAP